MSASGGPEDRVKKQRKGDELIHDVTWFLRACLIWTLCKIMVRPQEWRSPPQREVTAQWLCPLPKMLLLIPGILHLIVNMGETLDDFSVK